VESLRLVCATERLVPEGKFGLELTAFSAQLTACPCDLTYAINRNFDRSSTCCGRIVFDQDSSPRKPTAV